MPAHPPRARITTKLHSRRLERRSRLSCPPDVAARPSLTPATFALAQAYDDDPGTNRRQVVLDVVSPAALARVGQEPARARGVPTPHRARCPRQPAARARTLARREHRPPPCVLPARWRRRSPHSCRAACVPQVSGRGDRDGEARLEPRRPLATHCALLSRSPSPCTTPVRRPLARPPRGYDSCVCRVLGVPLFSTARKEHALCVV